MAQFLSSLNINDVVKFGKYQVNSETPEEVRWRIVAKQHSCIPEYPSNSVTLNTDSIIDLRPFDALEPTNPDFNRSNFGNNRFAVSNMLSWLNSTNAAGEWYSSKHTYDSPPDSAESINDMSTFYMQRPGVLHYFSDKEVDAILPTNVRVAKNISVDGGSYEDIITKVYLPSTNEVGLVNDSGIDEGSCWEAYSGGANITKPLTEQCYDNTLTSVKPPAKELAAAYWLRTLGTTSAMFVKTVSDAGALTSSAAYSGGLGVCPVINLSADTLVTDTTDEDGCYAVIIDEKPIVTARESGNLGKVIDPISISYTIEDADNDSMTVFETLDGEELRTLTDQTSGTNLRLDLSDIWDTLEEGVPHTLELEVTDGILSETRTWTFTKLIVAEILQEVNMPPTDRMPEALTIKELKDIDGLPMMQLLIANNGMDDEPCWEDITPKLFPRSFAFENDKKTAEKWQVKLKCVIRDVPYSMTLSSVENF